MDIFILVLAAVLISILFWIFDQNIRRFLSGIKSKPIDLPYTNDKKRLPPSDGTMDHKYRVSQTLTREKLCDYEEYQILKEMNEKIRENDVKLSKFKPPYEV